MKEGFRDQFRLAPVVVEGPRQASRDSLLLSAPLRILDGLGSDPIMVRVRNLSAGGMMAEGVEPLPRNTAVEVELRGIGAVAGKVAWSTDARIGIAFDDPIDPMRARKPVGPQAAAHRVARPL